MCVVLILEISYFVLILYTHLQSFLHAQCKDTLRTSLEQLKWKTTEGNFAIYMYTLNLEELLIIIDTLYVCKMLESN